MVAAVVIISLMLVCLSPFIGVGIGIHFNEEGYVVAFYGILSTSIVGTAVILALMCMATARII